MDGLSESKERRQDSGDSGSLVCRTLSFKDAGVEGRSAMQALPMSVSYMRERH